MTFNVTLIVFINKLNLLNLWNCCCSYKITKALCYDFYRKLNRFHHQTNFFNSWNWYLSCKIMKGLCHKLLTGIALKQMHATIDKLVRHFGWKRGSSFFFLCIWTFYRGYLPMPHFQKVVGSNPDGGTNFLDQKTTILQFLHPR